MISFEKYETVPPEAEKALFEGLNGMPPIKRQ